jgi:pyridoxine 5'-phosphate synthase PdxJ
MSKQESMQNIIERFVSSGESRRSFCLKEGINYHTLKYWQHKLRTSQERESSFVRIEKPTETNCLLGLELEFPNGVKIRNVNSLALIGQLISLEKCSV